MTPRKVHYWLDEGILDDPIRWGARGVPTLLSFHQVLRIRLLQRLREDLGFSLRRSRYSLEWIVRHVLTEQWEGLRFFHAPEGHVGLHAGEELLAIPFGQSLLQFNERDLERFFAETHDAWEARRLPIADFPRLVSDPAIMGGSPVISGSRIETAFVAHLAQEATLSQLHRIYPQVDLAAIEEAAHFEGVQLAA